MENKKPSYKCISSGYERTRSEIEFDVSEFIAESNDFNQNLANVISGINHEVAPWLGGAINTIARLKRDLIKSSEKCERPCVFNKRWNKKIESVLTALHQATEVMATISHNVKRLKRHTVEKTSVLNTVRSWFSVIFVNDTIKGAIEKEQVEIEEASLSFEALHSPMLLAQVFLNLVKNSIDHNPDSLPELKIRIYGECDRLVIEDNGKGVSDETCYQLFVPEVTTKTDGGIHGLGLASCKQYCEMMGAAITAENIKPHGLKLVITFAQALS